MIKIEKPNSSTINITIKSENGICPFCDGTGWQKINQFSIGVKPTKVPVKISVKCEWCEGTGKRA